MLNRRNFIIKSTTVAGGFFLGAHNLSAFDKNDIELTILHTNDVHSRIEAFPIDHRKYPGLGGAEARAALIKQFRATHENVLLLDSGDMFQGTPYFNEFGGELEFKLMSEMGYDVATIGNHDFDAGLEGLKRQLPHANFDIVSANYDFTNTILEGVFSPYKIVNKGGIKIGIFGVGVELDGLVPSQLFKETKYLDPYEIANNTAKELKINQKCDLVICLSHLGYTYDEELKPCDLDLAARSKHIDLILGGHTHTYLEEPTLVCNLDGEKVVINQVGWAGLFLGKISIIFSKKSTKKWRFCKPVNIR